MRRVDLQSVSDKYEHNISVLELTTELQAVLSRRIGDDRKEWIMGLGEDSELESESQRSESEFCKTGLESTRFGFRIRVVHHC